MKTNQHLRAFICIVLFFFSDTAAMSINFFHEGITYTISSSSQVEVAYGPMSGSVTIPSSVTYNGTAYTVTAIANRAFVNSGMTDVDIPTSVTSIGIAAFGGCKNLSLIFIPSSVTFIGFAAFTQSTCLITVDGSNPNYSSYEGMLLNKDKTNLIQCPISKANCTIPLSVTTIENQAFYYCSSLSSITIPSSVTTIGDNVFNNCSGLISITIPSSVNTIGDGAFFNCTGLIAINIPSSTTAIGIRAFYNCKCLITVDSNNPNYSSYEGAFFNKDKTVLIHCPTSKTNYDIPLSVNTIESYAFNNCTKLSSITIPSSVTAIGDNALRDCTVLNSVTIQSLQTTIGDGAFSFCPSLRTITVYSPTPYDLSSSSAVFFGVDQTLCTLYVPSGSKSLYQAADQWKDFTNILELNPSAVNTISANTLQAYVKNGKLRITNIPQYEEIKIYNSQGVSIYNNCIDADELTFNLPTHGVYVIKVGIQSKKIVY